MPSSRDLLALLLLSSCSLPVLAGVTTPLGGGTNPKPEPPSPFAGSILGAVAVGEFSGDLALDAVVLASGVPTLCLTMEMLKTSIRWDGGVAGDLVAVPSASGPDRLFVVSAAGLQELLWNSTNRAWDTVTIDAGSWAGARVVTQGDLDGDGVADLVGLSDATMNDRGVLLSYGDGSGGFGPAVLSFNAGQTARDVLTIDWDGDGTEEIVVLTSGGVELYEEDGTPISAMSWVDPTMMMAVLDDPAQPYQRLALVLRFSAGGPQLLVTIGAGGIETPLVLGTIGVVSVAGADMDGDCDTDLLFGLNGSADLGRLEAHSDLEQTNPADPTFAATDLLLVPFGPQNRDPSGSVAELAAADFDHDGELEIFAPAQHVDDLSPSGSAPYSDVFLVDEDSSTEFDLRPGLVSLGPVLLQLPAQTAMYPEFTLTGPVTPLVTGPGQSLALEITLWRETDFWDPTDTEPAFVGQFLLPPAGVQAKVIVPYMDAQLSQDLVFGWILRQVITQAGVVVARGPATVGVEAHGVNAGLLSQLGLPEQTLQLLVLPGGTSTPDGSITVGTSVPRFEDDASPPANR